MTKIKLCGLSRPSDMKAVNELKPEYIGFVFAPKSKRYVAFDTATKLKALLAPEIKAVGVFVNEKLQSIAGLLHTDIIDLAQLHGDESDEDIRQLQKLTGKPIIKAFRITARRDIEAAHKSCADYVLLDAGAGTGTAFDWGLIKNIGRPYFLAGGLGLDNIANAVKTIRPYAVDVSSGIETNGIKDKIKMLAFVNAVRENKE